jgi:hypothetical protein
MIWGVRNPMPITSVEFPPPWEERLVPISLRERKEKAIIVRHVTREGDIMAPKRKTLNPGNTPATADTVRSLKD